MGISPPVSYTHLSPLFVDSLLPAAVEKNIGIPLPSLGLAGLYPFVFETLKDRDGFLLGHELMNKGAILFLSIINILLMKMNVRKLKYRLSKRTQMTNSC